MPLLEAIQKKEPMKLNGKKVGQILTHKNGTKILVINRTSRDIVRLGDNKLISHAMETDQACWPVETPLLTHMKNEGIDLLAINVKATKSYHISRLSSWIAESTVYYKRQRNRSIQRILPFSFFKSKHGAIKL